jgi:carbonic anhydrase
MDHRLNEMLQTILAERPDTHVLRNAGGVVTEDVIRSLLISQRMLGRRHIHVIHHTDCGMLKFTDDGVKADIEQELGMRPPFALESFSDLERDVVQSIARVRSSPFVPHQKVINGFVFDVDSQQLQEVVVSV